MGFSRRLVQDAANETSYVGYPCFLQCTLSSLRDCICQDSSLLVVCQAVDVIFDIFGADECPPELFSSLSLMPVLEQCRASFKSRVRP